MSRVKSDGLIGGNSTKSQTEMDRSMKRYTCCDVLFVVALVIIGQGICFLGVSMLLDDVTVLPHDPMTLIGSMYLATGIAFILISKVFRRTYMPSENISTKGNSFESGNGTCKSRVALKNNQEENCKNNVNISGSEAINLNSDVKSVQSCADEKELSERKLEESSDQQWDIVGTSGDVTDEADSVINKDTITLGCDSAVILTSK